MDCLDELRGQEHVDSEKEKARQQRARIIDIAKSLFVNDQSDNINLVDEPYWSSRLKDVEVTSPGGTTLRLFPALTLEKTAKGDFEVIEIYLNGYTPEGETAAVGSIALYDDFDDIVELAINSTDDMLNESGYSNITSADSLAFMTALEKSLELQTDDAPCKPDSELIADNPHKDEISLPYSFNAADSLIASLNSIEARGTTKFSVEEIESMIVQTGAVRESLLSLRQALIDNPAEQ